MNAFTFRGFTAIEFPTRETVEARLRALRGGYVYAVTFTAPGGSRKVFYVGETGRLCDRVWDHIQAYFAAATDYKVGEGIRYLREKGYHVKFWYRASHETGKVRRADERKLVSAFGGRSALLNGIKGYDYKTANRVQERDCVRAFIDSLIGSGEDPAPKRRTA